MKLLLDTQAILWFLLDDHRLIIAQSLVEGMPLVSSDSIFDRYGVERVW